MESAPTVWTYVPHIKSRPSKFNATVLKFGSTKALPYGIKSRFCSRADMQEDTILLYKT